MSDNFKKCGVSLAYLKAMVSELEGSLTEAENVADEYGDVEFGMLSDSERIKFIVSVSKALGFAASLSEEVALLDKKLRADIVYGPIDPNKQKTIASLLEDALKSSSKSNLPPFGSGGGWNGGGFGVGGGGTIQ